MTILPSSIGALHPRESSNSSPPASPPNARCPIVLNVNALNPNPASTIPLAVARVLSEKDLATALTAAVSPAAPPQPDRNIEKQRSRTPIVDGSADGSDRIGIIPLKKALTSEYPLSTRTPPMRSGLWVISRPILVERAVLRRTHTRAPRVSVSLPHNGPMRYIPRFPAVPTKLTCVEDIVNCSASWGAYAEYTCTCQPSSG